MVLGWLLRIANGPFQEAEVPQDCILRIFSRPCGTGRAVKYYPGLRPGLLSAVPTGLNLEK